MCGKPAMDSIPDSKRIIQHRQNSTSSMARPIKNPRPRLDLEAEALAALEKARAMPHGPERTEAMKQASILQNAADLRMLLFTKRGKPSNT